MFVTAVKIAIVEALVAGYNALNPATGSNQLGIPSDTSLDLTPNSVTIEYPMEEVKWPAVYVQFRPTITQWTGLMPDILTVVSGGHSLVNRNNYFEGNIDLQILALRSEERDRLLDGLYNLILMNPNSPASIAFYDSLTANNLLGITILQGTVKPLGDTVGPGTPFSPEELTYEATVRIQCVGDMYEGKYNYLAPNISAVTISGTLVYQPVQN
jgi:hypothetical protein